MIKGLLALLLPNYMLPQYLVLIEWKKWGIIFVFWIKYYEEEIKNNKMDGQGILRLNNKVVIKELFKDSIKA